MIRIFCFEWKKTWSGKAYLLPAAFALILAAWFVVMGGILPDIVSGRIEQANLEMQPLWGSPITEDVKQYARKKALEAGAEDQGGFLSADRVTQEFGFGSEEWDRCMRWRLLANSMTLEEEIANQAMIMENAKRMLEEGRYSPSFYRYMTRGQVNPAIYEIVPGSSAWRYALDSEGYAPLFAGLAVLGLILLLLGGIFANEENGGLGEISLSTPNRSKFIGAKVLVALASGALIAFSLNLGLLLFYGLIFGFQGWNISALGYTVSGAVYGLMYRPVTCLELALLRLGLFTICGAFMGLLTAACSALIKRTLGAVGAAIGLCIGMESLLYIEGMARQRLSVTSHPLALQMDWDLLEAALTTPVRAFLNPEVLTWEISTLASSYSNLLMHNIVITPDLLLAFLLPTLIGAVLCACVCFGYERR